MFLNNWSKGDLAMTDTHTNGKNGQTGTLRLKTGLAEMLKGGVIMDVVTAD